VLHKLVVAEFAGRTDLGVGRRHAMMHDMTLFPFGCWGLVAFMICLARPASGQDSTLFDQVDNFAFLHYYGTGVYSAGAQSVFVIKIPPSISLRRMDRPKVGFRLRTALVLAVQDFRDLAEIDLGKHPLYSASVGLGVDIPVTPLSTLRPFVDAGYGVDNDHDNRSFIFGAGLRTEFIRLWKRWRFSLEPGVQFALSRSVTDRDIGGEYSEANMMAKARHPLWFRIGDVQPDAGIYASAGWLFDSLVFVDEEGLLTPIRGLGEVGVILGTQQPRLKVWFIRMPSVSVGYSFGGGFRGLRIRFGGDWVTPITESR
jgi:hypothetical protein